MRMPLIMGAFSETAEFLPVDNPLLDSAEAQRRMQVMVNVINIIFGSVKFRKLYLFE